MKDKHEIGSSPKIKAHQTDTEHYALTVDIFLNISPHNFSFLNI